MKKLKFIALLGLVSFVFSCSDDSPLKDCAVCTETSSGTALAEYCANKVTVEAYISTMQSTGYTCVKK